MTGRILGRVQAESGFSLVELLAVLFILGLMASVTALAIGSLQPGKTETQADRLQAAHLAAIRTGEPETTAVDSAAVRFLPDGQAIGPGVDPLTGAVRDDKQ